MKTIKWLWWKVYYLVRPLKSESSWNDLLTMVGRMRAPWHKFKPYVYQDEDSHAVEAVWSDDPTWARASPPIVIDLMMSQETGQVVGVRLSRRILESLQVAK